MLAEAEMQIIQENIVIENPQCMCCREDVDDIFQHKGACGIEGHYDCDGFDHSSCTA